jgi:translocator protein
MTARRTTLWPALTSVAAVATTAAMGALGTDPKSSWYKSLRKPSWQPPPTAFGLVWTPLYGLIAISGARVLARTDNRSRHSFAALYAYATDLALNAGWCWLFFKARRPRTALAKLAGLQSCNIALTARAFREDKTAGIALLPYVAWSGFAAALNASIVRRNR